MRVHTQEIKQSERLLRLKETISVSTEKSCLHLDVSHTVARVGMHYDVAEIGISYSDF